MSSGSGCAFSCHWLRRTIAILALAAAALAPQAASADGALTSYASTDFTCRGSGEASRCFCIFGDFRGLTGAARLVITNVTLGGKIPADTAVKLAWIEYPYNDFDGRAIRYFLTQLRTQFVSPGDQYISLNDAVQVILTDAPMTVGFTYAGSKPNDNSVTCIIQGQRRNGLAVP